MAIPMDTKTLHSIWKAFHKMMDQCAEEMRRIEDHVCTAPLTSREDGEARMDFMVRVGRINPPQSKAA